ncbi:MAG TPA: DUF3445 domain-containing protein [Acidimicrobiales bacterium]|nr:DUF3445 domain-containing protein [Acidimicrobiales bacterium]
MIPYVPLERRSFRLHMGLRPLEPSRWLEFDEDAEAVLALRSRLIDSERARVVALDEAGLAPSAELLGVVLEHLARWHPARARPVGCDHPLVEAARLVEEDLCVMVREDAWRLRAAVVCFPSRWDLREKIGATLREIHGPVPGYGAALGGPVDAFFERIGEGRAHWRLNWTLLDTPDLFVPDAARAAPSGDLADWYFRVERQTFRRLPESGAVVFTIRTYVARASELAERDPEFLGALTDQMASAPPATQAYKGWVGVVERLEARRRASSRPGR